MKAVVLLVVLSVLFSSVYSRQIKWTGQGGTNLWDFARNWDCNCIPTYSDDVSIDVPFSASNVRIGGSGATANSLVVGGSSQFTQSLYVQGSLTIGPGGGKIASNGGITLDSAPNMPFTSQGPFNAGSNLIFNSGALAGTGSFTFSYLNLTGPALKVFNASSVTVTYMLEVLPGSGNTGVVDVAGGVLTVTGDFTTVESLTLSVYPNARFNAKGAVVFAATGSKTFTFRGYSLVANLTIKAGNVVVNDNSDFGGVDIGSGGSLTLIGAASATRTVSSVTGAGAVVVQGGTNTFSSTSVNTIQVQSGIFQTDSSLTATSFQVTGGVLRGSGQVAATQVGLANAVINGGLTVIGSTLSLNGISSLNGSTLVANQSGVVTVSSQLTMSYGATFWVAPGATFSQGAPLKFLPSGNVPSLVQNDGAWTSTSQLTSVVPITGTGSWNLGSGAAFTITGVNFTANALSLTSATFTAQAAVVTLQTVSGSSFGTINFQGSQFTAQTLNVYTYVHTGGNTVYNNGFLNNITITTGTVTVSNTTVNTVDFRGGNFVGTSGYQGSVSATKTVLTTSQPKYLNNINVVSRSISLLCPGSCQLFTNNASLSTSSTLEDNEPKTEQQ